MKSQFFKYGWLTSVLGLLVYASFEIYLGMRKDREESPELALSSPKSEPSPSPEVLLDNDNSPRTPLLIGESRENPDDFIARTESEFESLSYKHFQEAGFTTLEAEALFKAIEESVAHGAGTPEADAILLGIRQAFSKLGLPKEREAAAYAAHAKVLDETGRFLDFNEWRECVQKKVAKHPSVDCLVPFATDYVNEISESLDSGRIYLSKFKDYDPIVQKYGDKILESCEVEEEDLARIFYFNLFDC